MEGDLFGSDIPTILNVMKRMLRARGMTYADAAAAMGRSESSLKRYLGGRRVTLKALEDLCRVLGIGLGEFYEIAAKEIAPKADTLQPHQEEALAADPELMILLVLLIQGWGAAAIAVELGLAEAELFPMLMRLERLGLAKVHPGNRVRLAVSNRLHIASGSPIRRGVNMVLRQLFAAQELAAEDGSWSVEMVRLSPASLAAALEMRDAFGRQVRELADRDRRSNTEGAWHFILSETLQIDLLDYLAKLRAVAAPGGPDARASTTAATGGRDAASADPA